jgi:predicted transcriptional regulator
MYMTELKSNQVNVHISDQLESKLTEYAENRKISRSAAARMILAESLQGDKQ